MRIALLPLIALAAPAYAALAAPADGSRQVSCAAGQVFGSVSGEVRVTKGDAHIPFPRGIEGCFGSGDESAEPEQITVTHHSDGTYSITCPEDMVPMAAHSDAGLDFGLPERHLALHALSAVACVQARTRPQPPQLADWLEQELEKAGN